MDLENQIKIFQEKLQLLLKQHATLIREQKRTRQELEKVKQALLVEEKQNEQLQQKLDAARLQGVAMEESARKELSRKIQEYVSDIDKCIQSLKK